MLDNSVLTSEKWAVTELIISECISRHERDYMDGMAYVRLMYDACHTHWLWNIVEVCEVKSRQVVGV